MTVPLNFGKKFSGLQEFVRGQMAELKAGCSSGGVRGMTWCSCFSSCTSSAESTSFTLLLSNSYNLTTICLAHNTNSGLSFFSFLFVGFVWFFFNTHKCVSYDKHVS